VEAFERLSTFRQEGTAEWIFDTDSYTCWLNATQATSDDAKSSAELGPESSTQSNTSSSGEASTQPVAALSDEVSTESITKLRNFLWVKGMSMDHSLMFAHSSVRQTRLWKERSLIISHSITAK
jgi:hypothetical protein